MKTKIFKSLLNIAPVILFAVAFIQLYRANMELKYKYEELARETENETDQLVMIDAALFRRTHKVAQITDDGTESSQIPLAHGAASSKVAQ